MAHSHAGDENYFIDQVFAIGLCGALSACAILLYNNEGLFFLASRFRDLVYVGGIALGAVVILRAVSVWREAGTAKVSGSAHDHDHDHDHHHHDHDHEHHHHGHDHTHAHDHDHEHGWAPWRYVLLLIPVALFFMGLPTDPASVSVDSVAVDSSQFQRRGGIIHNLKFTALEYAARNPNLREKYSGRQATMIGQFVTTGDPSQFGLTRKKMVCCSTDAIALKAIVMVDPNWTTPQLDHESRAGKWVEVTGTIYFVKRQRREEHVPVFVVYPPEGGSPNDMVKIIPTPPRSEWFLE